MTDDISAITIPTSAAYCDITITALRGFKRPRRDQFVSVHFDVDATGPTQKNLAAVFPLMAMDAGAALIARLLILPPTCCVLRLKTPRGKQLRVSQIRFYHGV